jgi:spermidine synthase
MKRLSSRALAACAVALLVNGVILGVEMLASRLLFPQYGNTIFAWSTIICIIIAGLFFGYMGGGWAADRSQDRARLLAVELIAGGLAVVWIPALRDALMPAGSATIHPPFLACFLAFGVPAALLASAPPACVGLLCEEDVSPAFASGLVSAISAAGSIAGTLLTTFYLVPGFGVRKLFFLMGALLLAGAIPLAVLAKRRLGAAAGAAALVLFGASLGLTRAEAAHPLAGAEMLYSRESAYQLVRVLEDKSRNARIMMLDSTWEGAMYIDSRETMFDYTHAYVLFPNMLDAHAPSRLLFIGGGAYTMPARVAETLPASSVEVAEIDPVVEQVGREYFDSGRAPNLKTILADGRQALRGKSGVYDGVFIDAYHGVMSIPFHLTTLEFFRELKSALKPEGFVALNLIGKVQERSGFFCSEVATLKSVFPHVTVYPVSGKTEAEAQNLIILAGPKAPPAGALKGTGFELGYPAEALACGPSATLVDDHAPVEWLVARYLLK